MSVDKRPSMEKIHIDPKTAAITSKVMARMTVSYVSTQAGTKEWNWNGGSTPDSQIHLLYRGSQRELGGRMESNTGSDSLQPRVALMNSTHQGSGIATSLIQRENANMGQTRIEQQWYALQVRPRFEKVVALHLQHKGYEEYLPLYRKRQRWSGRVKEVDLPLFPGYLFCKFDVFRRLPILVIPGVMSVVGVGRNPLAVAEEEITAVQNVVKSGLTYEPSGFITTGQLARVERGPLRGLIGVVLESRNNCRLIVSVNLLQRSVSVELDAADVMPVSAGNHRPEMAAV